MITFRQALMLFTAVSLTMVTTDSALARGRGGCHSNYHPRRHEVMRRDWNTNRRIKADRGNLSGHYGQLRREDHGIAKQAQRDFKQNGGYLTRPEQKQFNREENGVNRQIASDYYRRPNNWQRGPNNWQQNRQFDRNHPRRAEVLGHDNRLSNELRKDKGDLGGNYKSLMSQDKSIRQQEQADAKANGGYITKAQRQQLNQEEKSLQQNIKKDDTGK